MTTKPMTKKEANALRIAENKYTAYWKKVSSLLGPVAYTNIRVHKLDIRAAFDAGTTAEEFATSVACLEPVGAAIWPQKSEAMAHAEKEAEKEIERVRADLEKHGWNLNAAAPYPYGVRYGTDEHDRARAKNTLYLHLVDKVDPHSGTRPNNTEAVIVKMSDKGIARHLDEARREAGFQYDMFVVKMVNKVGAVETADISGSHIWGNSILTVTKVDGAETFGERWHTQQIVNYSKYGRPFYQWPSRKLK